MPLQDADRSQRGWARVAGLMYWVVLLVDVAALPMHTPELRRSLMLAGSVLTVPLALGLYIAVRPAGPRLAAGALGFRLLEAALGLVSLFTGYASVRASLTGTGMGTPLLSLAAWNDATQFGAFVFTLGSTIFFYLFLRSGSIPRVLAGWGLFASVAAFAACFTHFLRPAFPAMTMWPWMPMLLAETSTGWWLMAKSVRVTGD